MLELLDQPIAHSHIPPLRQEDPAASGQPHLFPLLLWLLKPQARWRHRTSLSFVAFVWFSVNNLPVASDESHAPPWDQVPAQEGISSSACTSVYPLRNGIQSSCLWKHFQKKNISHSISHFFFFLTFTSHRWVLWLCWQKSSVSYYNKLYPEQQDIKS